MKGMYTTLMKRELWEHRWLWVTPVVVATLLVCASLVVAVLAMRGTIPVTGDLKGISGIRAGLLSVVVQLSFVSFFLMMFYLMDCLSAERKDRSILFWKSLPVSDFQTVITKFSVGAVLLPAGTVVLATVAFPLIYTFAVTMVPGFAGVMGGWNFGDWLRAELWLLGCLVTTILWYAPLAAWAMLVSVSTRNPQVLIGLPLVTAGICETIIFRTKHVWQFLRSRIMPIDNFEEGIQRPGLWIGLAVAAGMLYIVIRMRRYRDDT
jgi:ABC-2 type transport system permease protein